MAIDAFRRMAIKDWYDLDAIRDRLNNLDIIYDVVNDLTPETAGYDEIAGPEANGGKGFKPIEVWFRDVIFGRGHKIEGLYINRPEEERVALFESTGTTTIKNLTLEDVNITGGEEVASLCADYDGNLENVHASGTVEAVDADLNPDVGGLVTVFDTGYMFNVSFEGKVEVPQESACTAGGLAYVIDSSSTIIKASFEGEVTGDRAGGLASTLNNQRGVSLNCHVNADVSGVGTTTGLMTAALGSDKFYDCTAQGSLTVTDSQGGGLFGSTNGEPDVERCWVDADITADRRAGLIGGNKGSGLSIANVFGVGSVECLDDKAGGLFGNMSGNASNMYAACTMTYPEEAEEIGGLVGNQFGFDPSTISDSYWDEQLSGVSVAVGTESGQNASQSNVDGLQTAEMQGGSASDNMTALDFGGSWETVDDDYPTLALQSADPVITPRAVSKLLFESGGSVDVESHGNSDNLFGSGSPVYNDGTSDFAIQSGSGLGEETKKASYEGEVWDFNSRDLDGLELETQIIGDDEDQLERPYVESRQRAFQHIPRQYFGVEMRASYYVDDEGNRTDTIHTLESGTVDFSESWTITAVGRLHRVGRGRITSFGGVHLDRNYEIDGENVTSIEQSVSGGGGPDTHWFEMTYDGEDNLYGRYANEFEPKPDGYSLHSKCDPLPSQGTIKVSADSTIAETSGDDGWSQHSIDFINKRAGQEFGPEP